MSSRRKRIVRPSRAHGSSPRRASSYTVERGSASIAATSDAVITSSRVILRGRRGDPSPAANGDIALMPLPHEIARIVRAARRMSDALESPHALLSAVRSPPRAAFRSFSSSPPPSALRVRPSLRRLRSPSMPVPTASQVSAPPIPPHARPATDPLCPSLPASQPTSALVRPMFGLVEEGGSPVRSSGDPPSSTQAPRAIWRGARGTASDTRFRLAR